MTLRHLVSNAAALEGALGSGAVSGRCVVRNVAMAICLAGCTQLPPPVPAESPGSFGVLDAAYDRGEWRWITGRDGHKLLEHTRIAQCFVDPDPGSDFHDPGFTLEHAKKTFGAGRYDVVTVHEGRDFWIAVYHREGAATPALGVYADGKCREAAEAILRTYETKKGPA